MRTLHAVTTPAPNRVMPTEAQPTVERVLDGQEHTVRMELGPWSHEYLLDLFRTLDGDSHLRAMFVAAAVGDGNRAERWLQRAHIAHDITGRMSQAGLTSHDMDPAQADDLAEALTDAAIDSQVCRHDSYREDCQNLTDGDYCTEHDGSRS